MGVLWPGLMGRYGEVIGLPFALEGIAFFIEAIFLGIYLYAWDRLTPARPRCWPGCRCWSPASPARSSWSPRTPG